MKTWWRWIMRSCRKKASGLFARVRTGDTRRRLFRWWLGAVRRRVIGRADQRHRPGPLVIVFVSAAQCQPTELWKMIHNTTKTSTAPLHGVRTHHNDDALVIQQVVHQQSYRSTMAGRHHEAALELCQTDGISICLVRNPDHERLFDKCRNDAYNAAFTALRHTFTFRLSKKMRRSATPRHSALGGSLAYNGLMKIRSKRTISHGGAVHEICTAFGSLATHGPAQQSRRIRSPTPMSAWYRPVMVFC